MSRLGEREAEARLAILAHGVNSNQTRCDAVKVVCWQDRTRGGKVPFAPLKPMISLQKSSSLEQGIEA